MLSSVTLVTSLQDVFFTVFVAVNVVNAKDNVNGRHQLSKTFIFFRFSATPKKSKYVPHQQQMEYGAFFQVGVFTKDSKQKKADNYHHNNKHAIES